MVAMKKIKVVWLCALSNEQIRAKLKVRMSGLNRFVRKIMHKSVTVETTDFAVWNTNAIREFEKFEDVELHIIAPYYYLDGKTQEFENNGVFYHFFRDESVSLFYLFYKSLIKSGSYGFKKNRRFVTRFIKQINPNVIHLIGAENPRYSLSLLDVPPDIPTIVQLQTLINDPIFKVHASMSDKYYNYLSKVERSVLMKSDYIGTTGKKYINFIKEQIKPNARFFNIDIALGTVINTNTENKEYDFVYFASNVNKAGDWAIEAFGLAQKEYSSITLDVVGGYDEECKKALDSIIRKYGIEDVVSFEGRLESHEDVLAQIRKSRFALLPLKIDLVSSTIREAMANGLPVLTTDTGEFGTQSLNEECNSVLISPKGNHRVLADNMLRLLNDQQLVNELRANSIKYVKEHYDNNCMMKKWVESYNSIVQPLQTTHI